MCIKLVKFSFWYSPIGRNPRQQRADTCKMCIRDSGCVQQFHLYNTHTPFEEEQWVLLGIVDKRQLFAFSHKVTLSILAAAVISLLVGIIGLMIISRIVSQPIITLAGKVRKSNPWLPVHFGKINIREIDELSDSIEKLSSDVAESASKLSQIIEMTSDCIGAFEIHRGDRQVFYTKRFFGVLQVEGRVTDGYMTLEEFRRIDVYKRQSI